MSLDKTMLFAKNDISLLFRYVFSLYESAIRTSIVRMVIGPVSYGENFSHITPLMGIDLAIQNAHIVSKRREAVIWLMYFYHLLRYSSVDPEVPLTCKNVKR